MNYSAHAIEDFKAIRKQGLAFDYEEDFKRFDLISSMLMVGQKFYLPAGGHLLDVSVVKEEYNDLLKIPFPVCVLEFHGGIPDTNKNPYEVKSGLIHPSAFIIILSDEGNGRILIRSIYKHDGQFIPSTFTCEINGLDTLNNQLMFSTSSTFITFEKQISETDNNLIMNDINLEISTALQFMIVVNTKNVTKDKIFPSEKLNKKRCKNGKEPYDSYWVLDILKEEHERVINGGTHSSPRQHFRRGHLRRLQNGDVVWVRHCLVGNKEIGIVNKSYMVSSN